jgi:hypothetical protein
VKKTGTGQAGDGNAADAADRNENLMRSFARRNQLTLAATRALFIVFGESDDAAKPDMPKARRRKRD